MRERQQLVVLGVNYRSADLHLREQLAFPAGAVPRALAALGELSEVEEAVILSTCNRTEIYAILATDPYDRASGFACLGRFLTDYHGIPLDLARAALYYLTETDVVQHLFRVSSGLDSMVMGEVEILGQVKSALAAAQEAKSIGKWLSTLFRHALQAGKRARHETGISHSAASVSYAAVELVRAKLPELRSAQVLLVGAGATAELVARTLVANGAEGIVVVNRTLAHAERLATAMHGIARPLEDLLTMLVAADIVITSTDAPHAIITLDAAASVLAARHGRPLIMVDLAVPRDVDPRISSLPAVHRYDLDDLEAFVAANMERRSNEASKVDSIILEEIERFTAWQSSRKVVSTIAGLQQRAEAVRRAELERVAFRLGNLSEEERNAVEAATRAIVNKMLHHPISLLKEAALAGDDDSCVETVRTLFGLPSPEGSAPRS